MSVGGRQHKRAAKSRPAKRRPDRQATSSSTKKKSKERKRPASSATPTSQPPKRRPTNPTTPGKQKYTLREIKARADELYGRMCAAGTDRAAKEALWREAAAVHPAVVNRLREHVLGELEQADAAVRNQREEDNNRLLIEQADIRRYINRKSFQTGKSSEYVYCFEYGGMSFAAQSRRQAEELLRLLAQLFIEVDDAKLKCPRGCCNQRTFRTMMDLHQHMALPCDVAPPTHVTEGWLRGHPVAFHVAPRELACLQKTVEHYKGGPLNLLDPYALPYVIGNAVHFYPEGPTENHQELQHIEGKGRKNLFTLMKWKANGHLKNPRDIMYHSVPHLIKFPFLKAPSDPTFPEEAKRVLAQMKRADDAAKKNADKHSMAFVESDSDSDSDSEED